VILETPQDADGDQERNLWKAIDLAVAAGYLDKASLPERPTLPPSTKAAKPKAAKEKKPAIAKTPAKKKITATKVKKK
jgi:hypothetical protein